MSSITHEEAILKVIDRLEVGPVKIEKHKISAKYTIQQGQQSYSFDLFYEYEENVFEIDDVIFNNLATVIISQAALNYGLFCKNLTFKGGHDDNDRRFTRAIAEHIARESYANQIIQPAPYLIGEAAELRPIAKKGYLRADLEFPPDLSKDSVLMPWKLWVTNKKRHGIILDGRRESLISFGMLNEIGKDIYPIFIEDSTNAWVASIPSFKLIKAKIPHTLLVRTNVAELSLWLLKFLPFIDKKAIKHNIELYPLGLWNVPVRSFAALPLIKKHKIGRLILGHAYHTSQRIFFENIAHYQGFYDQSYGCDLFISRYFQRKGWSINQFSLVRPLSSLLIEKMLSERYPELQRVAVSCLFPIRDGERVLPCGSCLECMQDIPMKLAFNVAPIECGYSSEQIKNCLRNLSANKVDMDADTWAHMLYLLQQHSKSTDVPAKLWSQASSHPEVIQPRFVKERSPVNTIPTNLRSTVHAIYLQHAQQALIPVGRGWKDFDPLAPEHTMMLYPFEIETKDDIDQTILVENILMQGDGIFWGELPWPEIQQRLKVIDIAILPVGAIAQHGPHLPLDTKNYNSTYLAHKVALSCSSPKPLILPTIPYGVSYHHDEFPGTLSVSSNTLLNLIYDVGINAARSGVKKLVILNSHSGNIPVLNDAAQRISRDAGIFVCVDSGESSRADIYAMAETRNDVHAGEIETSRSLAVRPQLVRLSNAAKTTPQFTNRYLAFTSQRDISWYTFTKKITPTGIIGDPTHATAEKGENIWEIMIVHTVSLIEALKGMSLDEIYQLHY